MNQDGSINICDVVLLNKILSGQVSANEAQRANADVNADGAVDGTDSVILVKFLVRLIVALPNYEIA